MKSRILTIIFFFLFFGVLNAQMTYGILVSGSSSQLSGQNDLKSNPFEKASNLDIFLSSGVTDPLNMAGYKGELTKFIRKQKNKNVRNQEFYLENLFYKVHNKFLKHYKNYVSFDEIFKNGNYDCVTGTALYALILDELGYDYHIYESNFHVLLIVNSGNKNVLFESTDFYSGFINDEGQIESRILHYEKLNNEKSDSYYTYQINNNRFINSRQLAGLLFFNLAVKEYNSQNLTEADNYLEKAEFLYESSRTKELRELIEKASFYDKPLTLNK